jgi:transposase
VPKGVTVILDRALFHRKKKLAVIVERVGVSLLFLSTYCLILIALKIDGQT